MDQDLPNDQETGELETYQLHAIRNRWTARSNATPSDLTKAIEEINEAQRDIGLLLSHIGIFEGDASIEE